MPATLIKLITNNRTREFRPDNVDLIDLPEDSSTISISMVSGSVIKLETPSPADALVKLAALEAAFVSGTGIVTITDENTAVFTTTTTLEPVSTTTTCAPLTIYFNADTTAGQIDFTVINAAFTTATVVDPNSVTIDPSNYVIYSVDLDTFIYGIPFTSEYGNWTITIDSCDYIVNVISTTTTTTTAEPTTTTTTII